MSKIVDARGLACPGPVIEAKKILDGMKNGQLEVLVDNQIAVQNLIKLAQYYHVPVQDEKLAEKEFKVVFQISEKEEISAKPSDLPKTKDQVVVLSSDRMGEGDPELGKALMKGFIYALTELDQYPQSIILYNGGARLSTAGSDSLEDLRHLSSNEVEIMTCGACLKHYGLEDELEVGTVTNMYAIAELLSKADRIIKP